MSVTTLWWAWFPSTRCTEWYWRNFLAQDQWLNIPRDLFPWVPLYLMQCFEWLWVTISVSITYSSTALKEASVDILLWKSEEFISNKWQFLGASLCSKGFMCIMCYSHNNLMNGCHFCRSFWVGKLKHRDFGWLQQGLPWLVVLLGCGPGSTSP